MPKESEFTKQNPEVDASMWLSEDEQAAESEVGNFVYGLLVLIKPKMVIETGCYTGGITVAIGMALNDNNLGRLITCDVDEQFVRQVAQRVEKMGFKNIVVSYQTGIMLIESQLPEVDFAFIDSGYNDREEEIRALLPKMSKYGIIALHDTAPHHSRIHQIQFKFPELQRIYLNTPRGLTLFQKIIK